MPSIGDIANEAKALLEKIDANTAATKNNTASTDNHVVQLTSVTQSGFTNLSQGMAVQMLLQKQANELLYFNAQQNETIICWLKNIAQELCALLKNSNRQTEMQKNIADSLIFLNRVLELVHAREAIEVKTRQTLEAKMNKCCPPREEPEMPCYTECKTTEMPKIKPFDNKWEPLKANDKNPK